MAVQTSITTGRVRANVHGLKWAAIIIAVFLPCAIGVLFWKLAFPSAMAASLALIAVIFFATLPWTVGSIFDRWRNRNDRPPGGTVVKPFEDAAPDQP